MFEGQLRQRTAPPKQWTEDEKQLVKVAISVQYSDCLKLVAGEVPDVVKAQAQGAIDMLSGVQDEIAKQTEEAIDNLTQEMVSAL